MTALWAAVPARADGDPASDVLFDNPCSSPSVRRSRPASGRPSPRRRRRHAPADLRSGIALIATPTDLGAVPSLFGQPSQYARFLGTELKFVYGGRLLVVMPQGVALSQRGRLLPWGSTIESLRPGASADALVQTALTVIGRLVPNTPARAVPTPTARAHARAATEAFRPASAAATRASTSVPLWEAATISVASVAAFLLVGVLVIFSVATPTGTAHRLST